MIKLGEEGKTENMQCLCQDNQAFQDYTNTQMSKFPSEKTLSHTKRGKRLHKILEATAVLPG